AGDFFQQAGILRAPPQRRKKAETQTEEKCNTGINYLKKLVQEHRQHKEILFFGPMGKTTSDNRFTLADLLTILERKGFHITSFERKEAQRYFDTYGPFDHELAVQFLEKLIELKGTKQHISFYLEKLVMACLKRRSTPPQSDHQQGG
ncbi:MAG: hypothetical protein AAB221_03110, partial [Bacteroidota bacterium]